MYSKFIFKISILVEAVILIAIGLPAFSQTVYLKGKVVSQDNPNGIPGVTVSIVGTSKGTLTDEHGNYDLADVAPQDSIAFSFVGYKKQVLAINGRSRISVTMQLETSSLNQVVVVGYGTQKKVNLTGAVATVSGKRLANRPVANVGEALQGEVPNLNVNIPNGDPSSNPSFNVRGFTSINGGSPLIVIDGVPADNLNNINPNDIQSISVLKDASSAAVYGARAAYGVILVTTKHGSEGKINISLGSQYSMGQNIFNEHVITDPYTYVSLMNVASQRTSGSDMFDKNMVAGTKAYSEDPANAPAWKVVDGALQFYGNNNYQHQILNDFAPSAKEDISISGGSENADYYLSFGAFTKNGYLSSNNIKFKRYNVLMKTDFKPYDWLKIGGEIRFNSEHNDQPHFYNWDVNVNSLARVSPIMPVAFPDLPYYLTEGDHDQYAQYIGMYFGGTNFFPYLLNGGRDTYTNNDTWLTARVTLTPLKGLEINSDFTPHLFNRNHQDVASKVDILNGADLQNLSITNGFSSPDWIQNENNYNRYYVFNAYAKYAFDLADIHHIAATVGFNQEWGRNKYIMAQAYNLISSGVTDLHATTGTQQTNGSSSQIALRGAFYRVTYNYKDRYLLEADGRYDGTSRFPKDSRFGFFPAFSAGWRISNESFMESTSGWLENLKLRASYGSLGNQDIGGYYPYIATMNSGQAPYILSGTSRSPVLYAPDLISPALTWETVVSKDLGVDFTILQERLDASFDVYTRDTKNMLMQKEYPDLLGADAPQQNAANLRTKGWELAVSWRNKTRRDFNYNIKFSLSNWSSVITKYDNPSGNINDYYVGKKIGTIWGYQTVGIFQSQADIGKAADQSQQGSNWQPGDIHYADIDGNGKIGPGSQTLSDHGDLEVIGNNTAHFPFGVNIDLNYKHWHLNTFFQGVAKRKVFPDNGNWTWFFPFNSLYLNKTALDTWSESNPNAYFYAPTLGYNTKKNLQTQTRYLQNAAYIRLKNITLSYDLPEHLLSKTGVLNYVEIYLTGMNIWTYSPIRKPLDPESPLGAIEYPLQREFTIGLNISL